MARTIAFALIVLFALIAGSFAMNLYQTIQSRPELSGLAGALAQFNLLAGLNSTSTTEQFTVFAPTNAAVGNFAGNITSDLLLFHVLSGAVFSGNITNDLVVDSTLGAKRFNIYAGVGIYINGNVRINTSAVDIIADNGT